MEFSVNFDEVNLDGGLSVYYIYSDEAGTSFPEPVTVVVGIIVHADNNWLTALHELQMAINKHVPDYIKEDFFFHAKDIWSGYRDYDRVWPRSARAKFIGAVAAIPRKLKMAIAIGKVRRDFDFPIDPKLVSLSDFHHSMAFAGCMGRANKYVRDWGMPNEVATVVAEGVPKKQKTLKAMFRVQPNVPMTNQYVIPTYQDKAAGKILQTNSGPIDRIIDTIHFVEKREAPLLQIADACAFSFRRYFADQEYGCDLLFDMLGEGLVWSDWQGPMSEVVFSFNPEHRYPKTL